MEPFEQELISAFANHPVRTGPARILIVAGDDLWNDHLLDLLVQRRHECHRVHTAGEARGLMREQSFDLRLIAAELVDGPGIDLLHESPLGQHGKVIMIDHHDSAQSAIRAMRCGAIDFLTIPVEDAEFTLRVTEALKRSRADQQRDERLVRLKEICKQLNIARSEISEQVDLLCQDLVNAYHDINQQLNEVAMASEFRTLLQQELDVEDLLRTAMEYLLTKTGPTNAAVFLPEGDGSFNLGAYVNYDCPRESINYLLEKLGEAICPQMENEAEIISFDDARDFADWIGVDAGMLGESQVIAFACQREDDCLAVVALFRDRSTPFMSELASVIDTLRPIFATQLANIIKVHHRAEPHWPTEAASDELDFDDEFGFGGAAA